MPKTFTLPKSERLYLRSAVSELFAGGRSFMAFPYRVTFRTMPESDPQPSRVAIMAIAPKKRLRHAVDRNRVKRLIREAYRTQKLPLVAHLEDRRLKLAVAFIYCGDTRLPSFDDTRRRVGRALSLLIQHTSGDHTSRRREPARKEPSTGLQ